MTPKQTNFTKLEQEGLIVPGYEFTEQDKRAIESLSAEEVQMIIRTVRKLAPNWPREQSSVRGIIL
jgi:hypothetical protein